jgi:hypothetical protein
MAALREAARFDDAGLWSHDAVWFSRYGTLVSTIESFVNQSPRGWFADELADVLHAEVQDPLHDLVRAERLRRSEVAGRFLYTSADGRQARDQLRTRQTAQSVPLLADASALQVSPDELKAAILLFYSLLDEQQRRLFAGWSPSSWDTEAIAFWPSSSAWTRTPSPADASNCSIRMYRRAARAVPAADANQSKKNRRHRHADRVPARIRHRWRSHHRAEVVSPHYRQDCHGAGRLRRHVSPNTVARLLHQMGYSLRVNHKKLSTDFSPDRNDQFLYLGDLRRSASNAAAYPGVGSPGP